MKTIKLCCGCGNGKDRACLLTASNMILGRGHKYDSNKTVDYILRGFIPCSNDSMNDELRSEVYSEFIWEINYSVTGNFKVQKERVNKLIELVCFTIKSYLHIDVDGITAQQLVSMLYSSNYNGYKRGALQDLLCVLETKDIFLVVDKRERRRVLEAIGTRAATLITTVYKETKIANVYRMCGRIISEILEIGDKRPKEQVYDYDTIFNSLGYYEREEQCCQ